jgi:hypothetical protein
MCIFLCSMVLTYFDMTPKNHTVHDLNEYGAVLT